MKRPVLFSLTLCDDILWRYAELHVLTEIVSIKITWLTKSIIEQSRDIYIEVLEGNIHFRYYLKFIKNEGDLWYFKISDRKTLEMRGITIDHKELLTFKFIDEKSVPSYLNKAYHYNLEESSISNHLSALIKADSEENRALTKFMIELNSKIDTIIDLLEKREEFDTVKLQGVGINLNSFIVFSHTEISDGTLAFTKNILGSFDIKFRFATVVKFAKIKPAATGTFYRASFVELQEDTKDKVINFIFSREREMIKNVREKDDFPKK